MRFLFLPLLFLAQTMQQAVIMSPQPSSGAIPTSSPSASNVGNSATGSAVTITPGATFAGTSGSLVFLTSKSGTTVGTATVAFTLTGATCSASSLTTASTFYGSSAQEAVGWCLLSNTATVTPSVAWTGVSNNFTDLTETMFTSTSGFAASPLDQSINTASGSGTSCASGSTASATTNANDLVVGVGFNFGVAQTYGAGTTGYTTIPASGRNTTTVQYKNVSATGTQSFTVAITSDVWACGVYAFKMN